MKPIELIGMKSIFSKIQKKAQEQNISEKLNNFEKLERKKSHISTQRHPDKGTFLSEDPDVFVITSNRPTIFIPETENCLEIEDVLLFESLKACKGKKATFGWLGQS